MPPRDPDIDADLEVLFYCKYLLVIQDFSEMSKDGGILQFEDLVAKVYTDADHDRPLLIEQSRTFLLRQDMMLNILQYFLLKYIRLQDHGIIDDRIPFLTYAVAQSQFFSQYTTPEGILLFINSANDFVQNSALFFFKENEHLLAKYSKDKMITMNLDDNIHELNKILEEFTPRRRSERKRTHVDAFSSTTTAYGSYIENKDESSLINYVKFLLKMLIDYKAKANKEKRSLKGIDTKPTAY